MGKQSIYQAAKALGLELDNWQSDLHLLATDEARGLVNAHPFKGSVSQFRSEIDGRIWFDIPFAFEPYWVRGAKSQHQQ